MIVYKFLNIFKIIVNHYEQSNKHILVIHAKKIVFHFHKKDLICVSIKHHITFITITHLILIMENTI